MESKIIPLIERVETCVGVQPAEHKRDYGVATTIERIPTCVEVQPAEVKVTLHERDYGVATTIVGIYCSCLRDHNRCEHPSNNHNGECGYRASPQ